MSFTEGTIPKKEEISTVANIHMESFFNGVDAISKPTASDTVVTTREIPVEALAPPSGLVSVEESTR